MTEMFDSGGADKIYEHTINLPVGSLEGVWTATVTGIEGREGLVTHTRTATIVVSTPPNLMVVKSANQTSAAPGDIVTYTIQLSNSGGLATQVVMEDDLSPYTALRIAYNGTDSTPFQLTPAGLGTADYSHDNGVNFTSDPLLSGAGGAPAGFDGTVTHWRIVYSADLSGGATHIIRYQVIIK